MGFISGIITVIGFISQIVSLIKLLVQNMKEENFRKWLIDILDVVKATNEAKTPEEKTNAAQKWVDIIGRLPR